MAEGEGTHGAGVLRELLAVFGFGVDTSELKEGESALSGFFDKVKKLAAGLAGVFAIKEIFGFVDAQARATVATERMAAQLGISVERVKEFRFASESLGMESETLLSLMGRLQIAQQASAAGGASQSQAFTDLGVKVKDASGHFKSADELFLDVAEGISKVKEASKQTAVATQLFGRSGRQLLPFLKEGRKGAEGLFEEFKKLGGGYDKEAAENAKKLVKEEAKLNLVFDMTKRMIASALYPAITKLVEVGVRMINWLREMSKNSFIVQAALSVMGAAAAYFAANMVIAAAPLLLITAAIAALILIVDDLMVLFEGGESQIGDWIDALWGKGASKDFVSDMVERYRLIRDFIKEAASYVDKIVGITDKGKKARDQGINALFGGENAAGEAEGYHKVTTYWPPGTSKAGQPSGYRYVSPDEWEQMQKGAGSPSNASLAPPPSLGPPPASYSSTASASSVGDININMSLPPGLDAGQVSDLTAQKVHEVINERNRAAAATFQRAPGS